MNTTKARIDRLTAEAVAFIRRAESLALKMDARGIHVAFSGGFTRGKTYKVAHKNIGLGLIGFTDNNDNRGEALDD